MSTSACGNQHLFLVSCSCAGGDSTGRCHLTRPNFLSAWLEDFRTCQQLIAYFTLPQAASHISIMLYSIETYSSAKDIPRLVWDAFCAHPDKSNIMYPHAMKALNNVDQTASSQQFWIACFSRESLELPLSVDFVLSCTNGHLGTYPIFIFTPHAPHRLDLEFCTPRINGLVNALKDCVPQNRVFSVFAVDLVTETFANTWTLITGIKRTHVYYHAKLTYCTMQSLKPETGHPDTRGLRLAGSADISAAATLCCMFAASAKPFTLTEDQATREATHLIRAGQLWVLEVVTPEGQSDIASIVAVTRTTETVAAITKVFTNPNWRRQGCAERLTRYVCQYLLRTKSKVILYVAHNNPAAAKVYEHVGFVGLSNDDQGVQGVDSWLEFGFDPSKVTMGHW
ncbi:hypothetical protein A0H81_13901 [Grifola frondosa]|uniref:N-acetyltransferase domain-containing protein n=1 Tax=Grifola frondosa TaxID=5627 RepID=A0A1C7LTK1_GRIFR|nr:hypothetical protein A0H81_13901 [Grifola frondosa]